MATPPLIDFPASVCAASVIMSLNTSVSTTVSPFSYDEQAFLWDGEIWTIEMEMPPIKSLDVANDWITFDMKLRGSYGYMLIGDPSKKNPRGVASGSPLVNGNGQTGDLFQTKGWTPNTTNILRKGDYIQIGTGILSRLHMVMDDVNSDASGNANLSIRPKLRYSPTNNDPIVIQNCKGVFKKTSNSASWSVGRGNIYRVRLSAAEVINA